MLSRFSVDSALNGASRDHRADVRSWTHSSLGLCDESPATDVPGSSLTVGGQKVVDDVFTIGGCHRAQAGQPQEQERTE